MSPRATTSGNPRGPGDCYGGRWQGLLKTIPPATMRIGRKAPTFPIGFLLKIRKDFPAVSHLETGRPPCEIMVCVTGRDHAKDSCSLWARRPRSAGSVGFCATECSFLALRLQCTCHSQVARLLPLRLNFLRFLALHSKGNVWYHLTRWKSHISVHNQEISCESKITIILVISPSMLFEARTQSSL